MIDELFRSTLSTDGRSASWLEELVSRYPGRFSGTSALAGAEHWAEAQFKALGADRVYRQETTAPNWQRGSRCDVLIHSPDGEIIRLAALAVGGSVGTPNGGFNAGIVEIRSLAELQALDVSTARDHVIFCNVSMDPTLRDLQTSYMQTSDIRRRAAGIAGQLGARGVLIRSLTACLNDSPHTGSMVYRRRHACYRASARTRARCRGVSQLGLARGSGGHSMLTA